jgi:hypothetical protein
MLQHAAMYWKKCKFHCQKINFVLTVIHCRNEMQDEQDMMKNFQINHEKLKKGDPT